MNAFTACPNGKYEDGRPHEFVGYAPTDDSRPLMFCCRCGETRYLAVAPAEVVSPRAEAEAQRKKSQ